MSIVNPNSDLYLRLDILLVERQLVKSRTQAQRLIKAGLVRIYQDGKWHTAAKASHQYPQHCGIQVTQGEEQRYISRAGLKLETALTYLPRPLQGSIALDIGQSTGGFTDCLLQHGAGHVVGIDVGRDQLAPTLRNHPQVSYYEGINARELPQKQLLQHAPKGFDLVVMDVSFISQTLILAQIPPVMASDAWLISLVKPQFEVGKNGISKGGLVKDLSLLDIVQSKICSVASATGLYVKDYFESSITGTDGNREFLLLAHI